MPMMLGCGMWGIVDGQTNGINFIPFVCPSQTPIRGERARARCVVVGIDDGQLRY